MSAPSPFAATAAPPPGSSRRLPLPSPFPLQGGGELRGAEVAVETWGNLGEARDNAVLVFTGLSVGAHAASHEADAAPGWWERQIGPGKALDTDRLFVICVNSLGSCFGSTGPASTDPASGQPYGTAFPLLHVADIARAGQAAVELLGIERLLAVVGPSLGGMTVMAHAAQFPGAARGLVSISGALAPHAYAIATRSLQREIVGTAWRNPQAGADEIANAMRQARKVGVLSYIGGDLLEKRFGRAPAQAPADTASGTRFEVESWLDYQAAKFERVFHPGSYWSLSRAMDLFEFGAVQVAPSVGIPAPLRTLDTGNASEVVVARTQTAARLRHERALVVGVHEDHLFPLAQQREVADLLVAAGVPTRFVEMNSAHGHDAFLVEHEAFAQALRRFLGCLAAGDCDSAAA
jgi:homoserine O-acetyltransferase